MHALYAQEPQPIGRFSGPFLAELEKHAGQRLFTVCELTAPWGTERWSNRPISHSTLGTYLGRVLSFDPVAMDVSERTNSLAARETGLELADHDFRFSKRVAAYRSRMRLSPAVLRIGARGIPESAWYTYFTGVLDAWPMTQAQDWHLSFRTNDLPLKSDFPKVKITLGDYPNANVETALGKFSQLVYGVHDSNGVTTPPGGAVTALHVDTALFTYELSLGWMLSVPAVYADGVVATVGSYSITHPLVNGRRRTHIVFTATQGEKVITADVSGLTDRGDGTGTLITRPAAVLQHWLVNFLYGDWMDGTYLSPDTAPVDTRLFWETDQFLTRKAHVAAKVLGGDSQTTGFQALEEWCDSYEIKARWTEQGKLGVTPLNHGLNSFQAGPRPWFKGPGEDLGGFSLPQNTRAIANRISVQYLFQPASGQFMQSLDVEDLGVSENSIITRELAYSADQLV
jgi:hypothetical protein